MYFCLLSLLSPSLSQQILTFSHTLSLFVVSELEAVPLLLLSEALQVPSFYISRLLHFISKFKFIPPCAPPPLVLGASGFLPPSFHQLLHSGATTFDCTQCPPGTFSNTSGEEFSEDKLKLSCAPTKQTIAYGHDLDH